MNCQDQTNYYMKNCITMKLADKKSLLRKLVEQRKKQIRCETGRKKAAVLTKLAAIGHVSLRQAQHWLGKNDKWMPSDTEATVFAFLGYDMDKGDFVKIAPPVLDLPDEEPFDKEELLNLVAEMKTDLAGIEQKLLRLEQKAGDLN